MYCAHIHTAIRKWFYRSNIAYRWRKGWFKFKMGSTCRIANGYFFLNIHFMIYSSLKIINLTILFELNRNYYRSWSIGSVLAVFTWNKSKFVLSFIKRTDINNRGPFEPGIFFAFRSERLYPLDSIASLLDRAIYRSICR